MALEAKDQFSFTYFTVWISTIKFTALPKVVWIICVKMEDIFHDTWRKMMKKLVNFNSQTLNVLVMKRK